MTSEPSPAKILVVRLDGIGDFVMFLDAARKLRQIFPSDRFQITLLGNKLWASLAKGQSCFDEVWDLSPRRFIIDLRYRYQMLKRVRLAGFSVLLNPAFSRNLLWADSIVHSSGCDQRIGFLGDLYKITNLARSLSARWYTRLIRGIEPTMNELEKNHAFVKALEGRISSAALPLLEVVESIPSELPPSFYVLCPGAGADLRRWAPENFAEIANKMFAETGWLGLVCGSEDDSILAAKVIARARVPLKDYCGKLSLPMFARTLAASKLLVANETGAIHMAAALRIPSVCILGGGHLGRFLPYTRHADNNGFYPVVVNQTMECAGCDWYCKFKTAKDQPALCVSGISVMAVWTRIQLLLAEAG